MSWSDDTRCLYCDGKLALYRKLTSGQFCSAAHRKAYWQEQERLAVERLHQTHDSLRAYRAPEALSPPPQAEDHAEEAAILEALRAPQAPKSKPLAAFADGPSVEDRARSAANTGAVQFAGFVPELSYDWRPKVGNQLPITANVEIDGWPPEALPLPRFEASTVAPEWEGWQAAAAIPEPEAEPEIESEPEPADPGRAGLVTFFDAGAGAVPPPAFQAKDGHVRLLPNPALQSTQVWVPFAVSPETPELTQEFAASLQAAADQPVEAPVVAQVTPAEPDPVVAPSISMVALPRISPRSFAVAASAASAEAVSPQAAPMAYSGRLDLDGRLVPAALSSTVALLPLELNNAPRQASAKLTAASGPHPTDLSLTPDAPKMAISQSALAPALRFAPGSRYRMGNGVAASAGNAKTVDAPQLLGLKVNELKVQGLAPETSLGLASKVPYTVTFRPRSIAKAAVRQDESKLAEAKAKIETTSLPKGFGAAALMPRFGGLKALSFAPVLKAAPAALPVTVSVAQAVPENPPMQPGAKLSPIEGELQPPPRTGFLSSWAQAMSSFGDDGERKHVWSHVTDFWQHAPRDLKLLSIAIPVLLGLALRPSLPKVRVTAPVARNIVKGSSFERDFQERLQVVRQTVAERAGVELNEDFRGGLDDWETRGDLSTAWSFDNNGFVKPGTLALYRPSVGLSDYEMEFLGLIEKKALSWVVRAADFDNYYVVKVVVLKPGPMPTIGIERYAVINGKAQDRVDTVAAINARTDMLYRVNLNVHDDTFLLTLQGTVVDNWTETRLTKGGIGFFAQPGEDSRLRWVQVTHQYDMLGRLCAYLAPYNIPNTNGSW